MKPSYLGMFSLHGKTAVVTGGSGVLGRHFCAGLAEAGANLAVVDINGVAARKFAEDLMERYGVRAMGLECDVSSPLDVKRMLDAVLDEFGSVQVLHNNAASKSDDLTAFFAPVETYSLDEWRKVMAVNIDGMFLVAQAVGTQMARQGDGGSIIQTSSIYGIMAPDARIYEGSNYMGLSINTPPVYSASKAAVVGLTRYLATYWASHRIRVNALVPGGVQSGQNDTFVSKYSERIPMRRMAQPSEMVGALLFLASDAASYVTGQCLVVDGGLSAW